MGKKFQLKKGLTQDPSLLTKTSFQKRGKDRARVYYYLPSGEPFDHYKS